MTPADARSLIGQALARIAPGSDLDDVDPDEPLTDELDLDSMDLLALLTALHESTGLELPESDAGQLRTLAGAIDYLVAKSG